jgi:hypothetical protein
MKQHTKRKLTLNKRTIQHLSGVQFTTIFGGAVIDGCATNTCTQPPKCTEPGISAQSLCVGVTNSQLLQTEIIVSY